MNTNANFRIRLEYAGIQSEYFGVQFDYNGVRLEYRRVQLEYTGVQLEYRPWLLISNFALARPAFFFIRNASGVC